jgi:hypothetical protein
MHMRVFAHTAMSVAVLLSAATDIRAGLSPAASQKATCAITGRVIIENEGAPGVDVTLQPATSSWPSPPPLERARDEYGPWNQGSRPACRMDG